ncbi:MAG: prolyl oligopeptidase family serine peptidase [Patescibacteria group bacterium]
MYPYRTRFAKDIVTEFLPPLKKRRQKKDRVIIYCGGMPGGPARHERMEFYAKKGFWIFVPRYRGTWESGGRFLRQSPEKDIKDVINGLFLGFTEAFAHKKFRIRKNAQIYLFGSSFGGPAAILGSRDSRVAKAVAFSPVADWKDLTHHGETNAWTERFTREAFGEAYRFSHNDWKKFDGGRFYNPMAETKSIDGKKILIFHAKNDKVVPWRPTAKLARLTGATLKLYARGGHSPSAWFTRTPFTKRIIKFLREK